MGRTMARRVGRRWTAVVAVVAAASLALTGCGGGSGDSEAFCAELRSFVGDGPVQVDATQIGSVTTDANTLLELAPSGEVRSALETMVGALTELSDYIDRINAAPEDALSIPGISTSEEELQRADETLRDYAADECDLELPVVDSTTAP